MLTLFTTCKPFTDQDRNAGRQEYAIRSWLALRPRPDVWPTRQGWRRIGR